MRGLGKQLSFQRIIALLMIAVALFPVISTTDDEVRYAFLHKGSSSSGSSVLNALLDSLDAAQVSAFVTTVATQRSTALEFQDPESAESRTLVTRLGRAPPSSTLHLT